MHLWVRRTDRAQRSRGHAVRRPGLAGVDWVPWRQRWDTAAGHGEMHMLERVLTH